MTAKEYLLQCEQIAAVIEQLKDEYAEAIAKGTSIASHIDAVRVQNTRRTDKIEAAAIEAADVRSEIVKATARLFQRREEIIKRIHGLHNAEYIRILYKVYVQEKNIKQAAAEMHRSYAYCRKVYNAALQAFEEAYSDILSSVGIATHLPPAETDSERI